MVKQSAGTRGDTILKAYVNAGLVKLQPEQQIDFKV